MHDLVQSCLAHTKRKYPDGYGFALTYLSDKLNPAVLRDAACRIVGEAYGPKGSAQDRKHSDLAAFVLAYSRGVQSKDWLIEAAQLVLAWGLSGDREAGNALAACGHPGYDHVDLGSGA